METLLEVRESGIEPQALRDRPALQPQYRHLIEAFYEVSAGRSIGEIVQPLPASEIRDHILLVMGVESRDELDRLFQLMRRLDVVYVNDSAERAKQAMKK
jgi:hypothetical protein